MMIILWYIYLKGGENMGPLGELLLELAVAVVVDSLLDDED